MTEMRLYDLRVTVERIEGRSVCGLEVGDWFEVTESSRVRIPEGRHFCLYAIQAVLPLLPAKMRRLADEDWLEQDSLVACPDPGRAAGHADRAHRRAGAAHRGPDVAGRGEVGLGLLGEHAPEDYEAIARGAEAAGIDVLTVFNDLRYQPALGPLLLMARVTQRIRLGPAALNPFTVHPYEIAGQTAFLDAVSGGRAYVGLAKGAWLDRLGLDAERPLSALQEAVAVVRALLAGDERGVDGERFRLEPGTTLAYPLVRDRVPLLVGSWGRRTLAWAGTVADEVKLGGTANPELVPLARGWIGNPATRLVTGCVTVVDEDSALARARAHEAVRPYVEVVGALDPTLADVGGELPLDRFCLAGTPEEVAARVKELWDAGVDRVELGTPQGLTTRDGVALICDRLLPLLA